MTLVAHKAFIKVKDIHPNLFILIMPNLVTLQQTSATLSSSSSYPYHTSNVSHVTCIAGQKVACVARKFSHLPIAPAKSTVLAFLPSIWHLRGSMLNQVGISFPTYATTKPISRFSACKKKCFKIFSWKSTVLNFILPFFSLHPHENSCQKLEQTYMSVLLKDHCIGCVHTYLNQARLTGHCISTAFSTRYASSLQFRMN